MASNGNSVTSVTNSTSSTSNNALRQTPLTCSGHTRPVVFLAFSNLIDDGPADPERTTPLYYCISACKDGKPMLRRGETGDWIGTFEGHKGAVWGVDLNKDGSKAATGAADFTAKVWNAQTGKNELSLQHGHIVKSVHLSGDSTHLATASNDKLVSLFDLQKPSKPCVVFKGHTSNMKQVLFGDHVSNTMLLSCSDDKTIRWWDTRSGEEVNKITLSVPVGGFEISSDNTLLTVAAGESVQFYDLSTLQKLKTVECQCSIYSASYSKKREMFICAGEDFKLYKYDFNTGNEIESFKGHFGPVHCVRFSPDSELYASGSEDGTLRLWQTEIGTNYGLWKCVETTNTAA